MVRPRKNDPKACTAGVTLDALKCRNSIPAPGSARPLRPPVRQPLACNNTRSGPLPLGVGVAFAPLAPTASTGLAAR